MQIATLSAQPRRRAPRYPLAAAGQRLQVRLDPASAPPLERLEAALSRFPLAGSLDWIGGAGSELEARSPSVWVSAASGVESELELRATTGGSERDCALVFELVQALSEASFGVHVTFSEKGAQRRAHAGRRALP